MYIRYYTLFYFFFKKLNQFIIGYKNKNYQEKKLCKLGFKLRIIFDQHFSYTQIIYIEYQH